MFDINFYNVYCDNEVVDKTNYLLNSKMMQGNLKNKTSITNPILIVNANNFYYNYCYIPSFNRFYYIKEVVSVTTGLWEIHLHVDVLMTYREGIYDMPCSIERNETFYDTTIIDKRREFKTPVLEEYEMVGSTIFRNREWSYAISGFQLTIVNPSEEVSEQ